MGIEIYIEFNLMNVVNQPAERSAGADIVAEMDVPDLYAKTTLTFSPTAEHRKKDARQREEFGVEVDVAPDQRDVWEAPAQLLSSTLIKKAQSGLRLAVSMQGTINVGLIKNAVMEHVPKIPGMVHIVIMAAWTSSLPAQTMSHALEGLSQKDKDSQLNLAPQKGQVLLQLWAVNLLSVNQPQALQLSASQLPASQLPASQLPASQLPASQLPASQLSANQLLPSQLPQSQLQASQLRASQLPSQYLVSRLQVKVLMKVKVNRKAKNHVKKLEEYNVKQLVVLIAGLADIPQVDVEEVQTSN